MTSRSRFANRQFAHDGSVNPRGISDEKLRTNVLPSGVQIARS